MGADLAPSRAADITFVGAVEATPALVMTQVRFVMPDRRMHALTPRMNGPLGCCFTWLISTEGCHTHLQRLETMADFYTTPPEPAAVGGALVQKTSIQDSDPGTIAIWMMCTRLA